MTAPIGPGSFPFASTLPRTELPSPVVPPGQQASGPSFAQRVGDFAQEIQALNQRADVAAEGYLRGEHDDVHGTMIAMQESDITFRLATNIRNRVIEAYREVMRMGS